MSLFNTEFDIESENFDLYFASLLPTMTPQAKAALPKEVYYKLFSTAGINKRGLSKLNFITRLFVLWKSLTKRWFIIIEDENNGLTIEQFYELKEAIKRKEEDFDKTNEVIASGTFVTGSKELCDTFAYLNLLSASNVYRYMMRLRNMPTSKSSDYSDHMKYLMRFLISYESSKKTTLKQKNITIPEFYVLIGLYHGENTLSSSLYKSTFKYCYQTSATKFKVSFSSLQHKGLIVKTGSRKGAKMRITPLGVNMVNTIMSENVLNF
jgi:hypothetical protein